MILGKLVFQPGENMRKILKIFVCVCFIILSIPFGAFVGALVWREVIYPFKLYAYGQVNLDGFEQQMVSGAVLGLAAAIYVVVRIFNVRK